jgi:predicted nucleic acid-binding protein
MNGTVKLNDLPDRALLLIDSSPLIYFFEDHPKFASRFSPVFDALNTGRLRLAVTTITIAEVIIGPLRAANEQAAREYRSRLESWQVVPLNSDIAESAARLRATLRLELPDAIQAASALSINAAALVTHDRDFSRLRGLRVIS